MKPTKRKLFLKSLIPWLFIIATAFIWLVVKLSKPGYSQTYHVMLALKEVPQPYRQASDTALAFEVTLSGRGFDLITAGRNIKKLQEIPLDEIIDDFPQNPKAVLEISQQQLRSFFGGIVSRQVEVDKIEPGFMRFQPIEQRYKKVAVTPGFELETAPGYRVTSLVLVPDSINITGEALYVDSVFAVSTHSYQSNDLKEDVLMELPLQNPFPGKVELLVEQVRAEVQIELWSEERIKVPIQPLAGGQGISPPMVEVTVNVPARLREKLLAGQFLFTLAAPNSETSDVFRAIELSKSPEWAEVVNWHPQRAAVIPNLNP